MSPAQLSFVIGVAVLLLLLGRALLNPVRPPLDKSDPSPLEQRGRRHATYVSLIHQALLPANAAYRMSASAPSVILLQTILGDDTIERWADICLS